MKYNLHDVLKKVITYYKRKYKVVKDEFLIMIWKFYHLKK
jgi:hypothetical protein